MAMAMMLGLAIFGCGPEVASHGDGGGGAGGGDGSAPPPAPVCGDGVVQAPETCDPIQTCPLTCPPLTCQVGTIGGSLADCIVRCDYQPVTSCLGGDGCCGAGCSSATDPDCTGIRLDAYYAGQYQLQDLGPVPGVPPRVGGVVVKHGDPSKLLVGGDANTEEGALYEIGLVRDTDGHIVGFDGVGVRRVDAAFNDGGMFYGPEQVLFLSRWPENQLGQTLSGSLASDKVIPLDPAGVAYSVAGAALVPGGHPGAGQLKLMSWPGGEWYTSALSPGTAPPGSYEIAAPQYQLTLPGGPEGMVYVPLGSSLFPAPSLLVSEFDANVVSTYEVDTDGNPLPATRRLFVVGLEGAEGATIDPTSGDFLFSTFGGGDRVIVVHGFAPIP
jgi:hypothetical protein